jgi:hypothetical protein
MEPKTMSELYPEDDPKRVAKLIRALRQTFEAMAEQENFTAEEMFLAAANAAALYATAHGFDSLEAFKAQEVMIIECAEHKRAKE